jgi:hypothetical protein
MIDLNSLKLIQIEDELIRLGWYEKHPKTCFCSFVAKKMGELGNDSPSADAIKYAKKVLAVYKGRVKNK